jgi:hypothetical protein
MHTVDNAACQPGGGRADAEGAAGKLVFGIPEFSSWRLALEPTGDPGVFIAGPGSDLSGEKVIFRRHQDGRVISVLVVQGTYLRLDHDSSCRLADPKPASLQ